MSLNDTILYKYYKKAKLLKELDAWYKSFDTNTKEFVLDLVQNKQLKDKGVDGKGEIIGTYSYATEKITKGRKQQGDHFTLEDTGYFFNSMDVEVTDALLYITGDGKKGKDNLYSKYGDYITTLTDENIKLLQEIIKKKYIEYVQRVLLSD
ncbi:hypothetical protein UFOVP104_54 [uncultured Caudovirales phage]|uniref:Uncharacterized protein n=1 Tax=uncultured Caudovirales phage TaxID=2100421 RepID=A0A6J5LMM1_9CAUD|nr:hypothetical protein UFOVP104_54 [uncultured Caudovirales phage]CAB4134240.1 hypothetical protein UFOVP271_34 [uncultured Caudovirales phage]